MKKFKIGSKVRATRIGQGVGNIHLGKIVKIENNSGTYYGTTGYITSPKIGNNITGHCGGWIGHDSFVLVSEPKKVKPVQEPYEIY